MRWRKRYDDWLDCQSAAWRQGHEDGYAGRRPDLNRDDSPHWRLTPAQRNYRDGFSTGQSEREFDERHTEG